MSCKREFLRQELRMAVNVLLWHTGADMHSAIFNSVPTRFTCDVHYCPINTFGNVGHES